MGLYIEFEMGLRTVQIAPGWLVTLCTSEIDDTVCIRLQVLGTFQST